jgi:hypothetical protein
MPLPNRGRFNKPKPPGTPDPSFRRPLFKKRRVVASQASSGMDPSTVKYIIFGLIFVVGNAILFFSTGYIVIPR